MFIEKHGKHGKLHQIRFMKIVGIYCILGGKFVGDMDVPSLKLLCNLNKNIAYEIVTNIKFMMEINMPCQCTRRYG
jgi:hypothetical protein